MNEINRENLLKKIIVDLELLVEEEWEINNSDKMKKALEILYEVHLWDML